MQAVFLDMEGMTIEALVAVARQGAEARLSTAAEARIAAGRALVDRWVREERRIYGVTTGFGALSDVAISGKDTRRLQENILMSHAAGVGRPLDAETVRAVMTLRVKDFARGHSGIRLETAQQLLELLNRGVVPVIPEKGSVGASGDLAPLAHLALVLLGKGEAFYNGRKMSGEEALKASGLAPIRLESAEGLALVNGTQVMTAIGALSVHDARQLSRLTDIAASMTLEVLMGSRTEFNPKIHQVRPHPGQIAAAANMERITRGSEIISSHSDCSRVQDAYTLRCSPQVHGATKDAIAYCRRVVETELNASTGNPLIFAESEEFLLGGNFHGQPVALAMDFLGIAVAELANISERRIERLVNPMLSGLPAFLVSDGGLELGLHDRPVHGGSAGLGEQGPGPPGQRRLHPHLGQQGGPRLDGDDRRTQGSGDRGQHRKRDRDRTALRGPGPGPLHQPEARRGHPCGLPSHPPRHPPPRHRPLPCRRHRRHAGADAQRRDPRGRGRAGG